MLISNVISSGCVVLPWIVEVQLHRRLQRIGCGGFHKGLNNILVPIRKICMLKLFVNMRQIRLLNGKTTDFLSGIG